MTNRSGARGGVQPPSEVAVAHVERVGGRLVEADLRALLEEHHGASFARRAIAFAILRGALERQFVGPVSIVVTPAGSAVA